MPKPLIEPLIAWIKDRHLPKSLEDKFLNHQSYPNNNAEALLKSLLEDNNKYGDIHTALIVLGFEDNEAFNITDDIISNNVKNLLGEENFNKLAPEVQALFKPDNELDGDGLGKKNALFQKLAGNSRLTINHIVEEFKAFIENPKAEKLFADLDDDLINAQLLKKYLPGLTNENRKAILESIAIDSLELAKCLNNPKITFTELKDFLISEDDAKSIFSALILTKLGDDINKLEPTIKEQLIKGTYQPTEHDTVETTVEALTKEKLQPPVPDEQKADEEKISAFIQQLIASLEKDAKTPGNVSSAYLLQLVNDKQEKMKSRMSEIKLDPDAKDSETIATFKENCLSRATKEVAWYLYECNLIEKGDENDPIVQKLNILNNMKDQLISDLFTNTNSKSMAAKLDLLEPEKIRAQIEKITSPDSSAEEIRKGLTALGFISASGEFNFSLLDPEESEIAIQDAIQQQLAKNQQGAALTPESIIKALETELKDFPYIQSIITNNKAGIQAAITADKDGAVFAGKDKNPRTLASFFKNKILDPEINRTELAKNLAAVGLIADGPNAKDDETVKTIYASNLTIYLSNRYGYSNLRPDITATFVQHFRESGLTLTDMEHYCDSLTATFTKTGISASQAISKIREANTALGFDKVLGLDENITEDDKDINAKMQYIRNHLKSAKLPTDLQEEVRENANYLFYANLSPKELSAQFEKMNANLKAILSDEHFEKLDVAIKKYFQTEFNPDILAKLVDLTPDKIKEFLQTIATSKDLNMIGDAMIALGIVKTKEDSDSLVRTLFEKKPEQDKNEKLDILRGITPQLPAALINKLATNNAAWDFYLSTPASQDPAILKKIARNIEYIKSKSDSLFANGQLIEAPALHRDDMLADPRFVFEEIINLTTDDIDKCLVDITTAVKTTVTNSTDAIAVIGGNMHRIGIIVDVEIVNQQYILNHARAANLPDDLTRKLRNPTNQPALLALTPTELSNALKPLTTIKQCNLDNFRSIALAMNKVKLLDPPLTSRNKTFTGLEAKQKAQIIYQLLRNNNPTLADETKIISQITGKMTGMRGLTTPDITKRVVPAIISSNSSLDTIRSSMIALGVIDNTKTINDPLIKQQYAYNQYNELLKRTADRPNLQRILKNNETSIIKKLSANPTIKPDFSKFLLQDPNQILQEFTKIGVSSTTSELISKVVKKDQNAIFKDKYKGRDKDRIMSKLDVDRISKSLDHFLNISMDPEQNKENQRLIRPAIIQMETTLKKAKLLLDPAADNELLKKINLNLKKIDVVKSNIGTVSNVNKTPYYLSKETQDSHDEIRNKATQAADNETDIKAAATSWFGPAAPAVPAGPSITSGPKEMTKQAIDASENKNFRFVGNLIQNEDKIVRTGIVQTQLPTKEQTKTEICLQNLADLKCANQRVSISSFGKDITIPGDAHLHAASLIVKNHLAFSNDKTNIVFNPTYLEHGAIKTLDDGLIRAVQIAATAAGAKCEIVGMTKKIDPPTKDQVTAYRIKMDITPAAKVAITAKTEKAVQEADKATPKAFKPY